MDFSQLLAEHRGEIFSDFISYISMAFSGKEIVDSIRSSVRSHRDIDTINDHLWKMFEAIGWKILIQRLSYKSLLYSFRVRLRHRNCEVDSSKELSNGFFQSFYQDDLCVCQYYAIIFGQIRDYLLDCSEIPISGDDFDEVFQGIEIKAAKAWKGYLIQMSLEYPQLKEHLKEKRYERFAEQIEGEKPPTTFFGADKHVLAHRIKGECFKQSITFSVDNSELLIRPEYEAELGATWWDTLFEKLKVAPLLLSGPGGMGKTAFLVYLYDSIQNIDTPFRGAFLLSLNTIMAEANGKADFDGEPLCNPERSILLRHIASRSGNAKYCRGWKRFLKDGLCDLPRQKPILLLLDGFNEMCLSNTKELNRYNQIMQEIKALANQAEYPYVRLIITTRKDGNSQTYQHLEQELESFQQASLNGIQMTFSLTHLLNAEMKKLLQRPMYYQYLREHCAQESIPSTQYELLKQMYQALHKQSESNTGDQARKLFQWCVMKYLMPILAYTQWRTNHLTDEEIYSACAEYARWSRMAVRDREDERIIVTEQIHHLVKQGREVEYYLTKQEQLLVLSDGEYSFFHQDYRDYLVAEYFLQRLDFMAKDTGFNLWRDEDVIDSLRLNTYSVDILRLIYQGVFFEEAAPEGEQSKFIRKFYKWATLKNDQVDAGHILWYTTIYQLMDMMKIVEVSYGGNSPEKHTFYLLNPFVRYVCRENESARHLRKILKHEGILEQHLIEILMKASELCRRKRQYNKVWEITRAAKAIYSLDRRSQSYGRLYSVIEHNNAMAALYSFAENGDSSELENSLEKFRSCVEDKYPYRFSCNALAMMLVSPHPKLKNQSVYWCFVEKFLKGVPAEVFAFWLYYMAIFDPRKSGESWAPRLYSARQLLYLLAENRVGIVGLSEEELGLTEIKSSDALDLHCIRKADDTYPIPSKLNLIMIERFLDEIRDIEIEWKHYMQGLIYYLMKGDAISAKIEFEKAACKEIRAKLWLAFLQNQRDQIFQILDEERPGINTIPNELEKYSPPTYYDRDIKKLADMLYYTGPTPY